MYNPSKELEPELTNNDNKAKEETVVLDGPIEEYEKTALMIQKKFRMTKKKTSPIKK